MGEPNHVVFLKDNYPDDKAMWEAIGQLMQLLTDNNYDINLTREENGIYVVRFDSYKAELANALCRWVEPSKWEDFMVFCRDED